ncbi:MAG: toprim domain-containing protein [Candidatus Thorarchaeota archaeon]
MTEENNESNKGKDGLWRAVEHKRLARLTEKERKLIEKIQTLDSRYPNLLVIVEGKRDVSVLRNLGLKAPIIKTQTRLSRPRLVEKIQAEAGENGQILILTDFDKKGKEIYKFIERELELSGIKNLKRERRMIRKYMEHWTTIEQLVSLFKRSDSPEASL